MVSAIYPGTFDPPTLGHVDIARRAARFFKKFYIAVGVNSSKINPLFSQNERIELLKEVFHADSSIEIVAFEGLLVDYVTAHSIPVVIRAVRTAADLDFEISQATLNWRMVGVETFWMSALPEYRDISSTLVQEIGRGGRTLKGLVPDPIHSKVERRLHGG